MIYLDATKLADYDRCMRLGWYRHERNWRKDTPAVELAFGGAWGKGQDALWGYICGGGTDRLVAHVKAIGAFNREWIARNGPTAQAASGSHHSPALASAMYKAYIAAHWESIAEYELVAAERFFEVDLWYGVKFCGWWDKLVRYRSTNRLRVVDHKTCGKSAYAAGGGLQEWWRVGWDLNWQMGGYGWAGHALLGDDFQGTVIDASLAHPKAGDGEHDVHLWLPQWTLPAQDEAWRASAQVTAKRIVAARAEPEQFGQSYGSCWKYNRRCDYWDLCRAGVDHQAVKMPANFKVEPWEPEKQQATRNAT